MQVPEPKYVGKVRDTYALDDPTTMLVVASDRISTYDVVHPTPIPGKGEVLNYMSEYWFTQSSAGQVVPNHLITTDLSGLPDWAQQFQGRAMVVKYLKMVPLEAIVRGYITGSAWAQYRKDGTMNGETMPGGMLESERFTPFRFTPSTKATVGHDENISLEQAADLIGEELKNEIERVSLQIYTKAHDRALEAGIILADTKFEFGLDLETGALVLADEVLTPDSSRFWPLDAWVPGSAPPSMDKQYVRDWATSTGWDKKPPAPAIPDEVVAETRSRYGNICERLTGTNPLVRE
jgi:phosphoribosylaminoimidazole-succinocarboxamide synthase